MSDTRRHPADVTAQRLLEHTIKYKGRFEGRELDALGEVRYALQRIAEEDEQAAQAASDHRSARNSWRTTG